MKQTLMILGVVLLGIAITVVYFERKLREQNHKIASMFSLVSSLAEELNTIKTTMICSREPETIHIGNQLIDVSDDEMELIEEDDDDVSEASIEFTDEEEESDEESDMESDEESEIMVSDKQSDKQSEKQSETDSKSNIKVLKLDLESDSEEKTPDWKKMSVAELRTIASEKGMDAAKLKKGELIELLSK